MERFSVKKPYTVLVAVLMVLVLGFVSLTNMTADLLPPINLPYMMIVTAYPGASPEKVEAEVTQLLESSLGTVSGVTNVYSTSSENVSMVQLEFEEDTNMDSAMVKVSSAVQNTSASLPETCGTPSIIEISPDMMATMYLGVGKEGYDIYQNSTFVRDEVVPYIERQPGVASVSTVGLVEKSIQVDLNKQKIDDLNDEILAQTDKKLAQAKRELDKAEKTVKDGKAALEQQKAAFGSMMASGVMGPVQGQITQQAAQIKQVLDQLLAQVEKLRDAANQSESVQALDGVLADMHTLRSLLEKAENGTASPEEIAQIPVLIARIQQNLNTVLGQLGAQPTPAPAPLPTPAPMPTATPMPTPTPTLVPESTPAPSQSAENLAAKAPFRVQLLGTDVQPKGISGMLDDVYGTLEKLSALAQKMPQLAEALKGMIGGLSQAQLEAAVGFSTAQNQLLAAQTQLEASRTQYETARTEALKNANLDKLLNVSTLSGLIYAQNFAMPAGYIDDVNDNAWLLKIGQEYGSAEDIAQSLLCHVEGLGDVRISDVADITVIDNAQDSYARLNGGSAVVLCVYKGSTAGTNDVSRQCKSALEELEEKHEGFSSVVLMDQGDYITLIVNSVVSSMVLGALLAIVVLALFLRDVKPTLVVGISIPLSVLFAIVLMYFSNLSLNMMTLSGLALGIGMLVDNSVVVIENIYRLRARGVPAARAAVQGTKQVAGSIIASTLTTVCVFLPMVFTAGTVRELLMPMGLAITYCLMASLIVAMTVVPAAGSTVLRKSKDHAHPLFEKVQAAYGKSLEWCLRHKAVPLTIAGGLLVFCMYRVAVMGIVILPPMTSNEIEVNVFTNEDLDRAGSYAAMDKAMDAMLQVEGIKDVGIMDAGSTMGMVGGLTGISTNGSYGSYICYVTTEKENPGAAEINRICEDLEAIANPAEYTIEASAGGMSDMSAMMGSGLSLSVYGSNLDTITKITEDVIQLVDGIEGFAGATNGIAESGDQTIQLRIDRDKAMRWGLTVAQVYQQISQRLTTTAASTNITVDGVSMRVSIQDVTNPVTVENLMDIPFSCTVMDDMGMQKTEEHFLREFAAMEYTTSVGTVHRENQQRFINVTAKTEPGYNTALLSRTLEHKLDEYIQSGSLPDGYSIRFGGETKQVNEMITQMSQLMLVALIFVYLVMVAQFQSLLSPFIVLFTVPLAFTGGLLGLMAYGQQLSMLSLMGFLVLMGTVVNNGIVFVDYTNQLRIGGMERRPALIAAGCTRMRPIFMTALTTILAMAQLIFGDDMGSQLGGGMAVVIASGLLYATIMTLYIVPVMYDILFKRPPLNVDVGNEDLDTELDDAAEYLAAVRAHEVEQQGEQSAKDLDAQNKAEKEDTHA